MMTDTMDNFVEVRGAYKSYDSRAYILKGLNLTIEQGTVYTLLGPSGCGKTTLLKCIVGRKSLDAGEIFLGIKSKSQVGYMPQDTALVGEITIKETLRYFGWIYNMTSTMLEQRKKELFVFLEMPPENKKVEQLSGGQKRRVSLCIALLHNPELMILDEPTVGIDPILCENIWNYLIEMSTIKHKTIMITTHYIEEARKSNKIGMMRGGELVAEGEPQSIMDKYGYNTLEEVFIHLSLKQEIEINGDNSKMEVPITTAKPKIPLRNDKSFSFNNLFAFLLKSFYFLRYSSLLIFLTVLFPATSCFFFQWSIGHDPKGVKIGVVNEELLYNKGDCNQFSNVSCFPASCHLIYALEDKLEMVPYKDISSAHSGVEKNQIIGFFHISKNFTKSLQQRIALYSNVPDEDLDQSEVAVWLDMSNKIIANYMKRYIYVSYFDLLDRLSLKCDWQVRHSKLPIDVKEPVHGKFNLDFNDFSANSVVLLLEFFLPVIYAITILQDKREGILERNLMSGLTYVEIVVGHTIATMLIFVAQITCTMVIIYVIYDHVYEGSILLALSLSVLVGISGMWYGLFIAMLCDEYTTATFLAIGTNIILTCLSGLFWSIEGMHPQLYSLKWVLPLTPATEAYRSITKRSWSFSHPEVYGGFLSILMWTGVFIVGTCIVIKVKKGADIR